jgi:hypothetical protein
VVTLVLCGGVSVILTEPSDCERGYLRLVQQKLGKQLEGVEVVISREDRDPLAVV